MRSLRQLLKDQFGVEDFSFVEWTKGGNELWLRVDLSPGWMFQPQGMDAVGILEGLALMFEQAAREARGYAKDGWDQDEEETGQQSELTETAA